MDRIGVRIDELEDEIYEQPSKQVTGEFLSLKRTILTIRRAVLPQKRIFTSINSGGHAYFDIREEIKLIIWTWWTTWSGSPTPSKATGTR